MKVCVNYMTYIHTNEVECSTGGGLARRADDLLGLAEHGVLCVRMRMQE